MDRLGIEFTARGLKLPGLGLWLDPHEACDRGDLAFVSHAHADHVADHPEVILSLPTARLMQARLPGNRREHVLEFGQSMALPRGSGTQLTLLPAGHIFGSAMAWIHETDKSLLYTGDFKLRKSLSAESCEPRPADVLIMETTFGRPQYVFPPTADTLNGVLRFCQEALDNEETPVLLGYSLGKSQELLCSLQNAGLPVMLHGAVWKMTQVYQQFGHCFPPYERYDPATARGKVLLCPPSVAQSALLRNLGRHRTAILTGWAVDPNCRYRYRCDAAFPLSDHADYKELLQMVRLVNPKKVLTLHGFAADFAITLRREGVDAHALSESDQLALPLLVDVPQGPVRVAALPLPPAEGESLGQPQNGSENVVAAARFQTFAETCRAVAGTGSKLTKVKLVAEYLRTLEPETLPLAITWFSGRPFPASHNKVLQVGWAALRDALCDVTSLTPDSFHQCYLKHSDLGETAGELLQGHRPGRALTLSEAGAAFERLTHAAGPRAKIPLLRHTLGVCSGLEAKYLVKIITGDLRIGLKEGLVEEAVAEAFTASPEVVRQAHLLVGDLGETAVLALKGNLQHAGLKPFRPIKFMLASPEPDATAIWERVVADRAPESATVEVWVEDKYDGVRCQLHKVSDRVALFSRDMKDVTASFPDLVDVVRRAQGDFILDGEIVAMRGDTILPFAELQRRLGRRERDLFLREEVPIAFVAFDLLWQAGATVIQAPLRERRIALEIIVRDTRACRVAHVESARSPAEIDALFDQARARGNEGLMIKDPQSSYSPGRRGLAWLKLKKALATLDCVVVGAEYGHGKRSRVLSDYTFAVRDETSGELKVIGKAYSGLTDKEIAFLTETFLRRATRQRGRFIEVPPEVVLEIAFDKIQPSPRHPSGLAMRFPRIHRIRTDKSVEDIDTLQRARELVDENC